MSFILIGKKCKTFVIYNFYKVIYKKSKFKKIEKFSLIIAFENCLNINYNIALKPLSIVISMSYRVINQNFPSKKLILFLTIAFKNHSNLNHKITLKSV